MLTFVQIGRNHAGAGLDSAPLPLRTMTVTLARLLLRGGAGAFARRIGARARQHARIRGGWAAALGCLTPKRQPISANERASGFSAPE